MNVAKSMPNPLMRKETLSVDEHFREMENLRIELRNKMDAEYWRGFVIGCVVSFIGSLGIGVFWL